MNFQIRDSIECLISLDPETKLWIGHCLHFDLVTSGKTAEKAWVNLKAVVKLHIEHSFTHDQEALWRRTAPATAWETFRELCDKKPVRSDKIEIDLIAPTPKPGWDDIWIKGIEIGNAEAARVQSIH